MLRHLSCKRSPPLPSTTFATEKMNSMLTTGMHFLNYTEANSQRNTDFGVHFFVFISIKIIFLDNTFRQDLKFDCA